MKKSAQIEGLPQVDEAVAGLGVEAVVSGGIGEAVGIRAGDVIEAINGESVRDPIDYRFHVAEEAVEVVLRRGKDVIVVDIEKDTDDDLGVTLAEMPIIKCNNKCVFCFLHQMPRKMRKTLYYQDDDYRLSFLHGAYVTLTNLSEAEFQRIVEQRLSPMYISVHATDPDLRGALLGRSEPVDVMERIDYLARHNIQMHAQVVLCPGVNDGQHLKRTVFDLAQWYPSVASVGIVPLGLTRYRQNLPRLDPVTPEVARTCLDHAAAWQRQLHRRFGVNFVYFGDEFYLMAGRRLPEAAHYDGFPLVENGVGMVRRFSDCFEAGVSGLESLNCRPVSMTMVTSVLGAGFIRPMAARLNRIPWMTAHVVEVKNRFLGEGITVSGLLTGQDMLHALETQLQETDVVILPPNCVSHHGLFLDDLTPNDLELALKRRVRIGTYDLAETAARVARGDTSPSGTVHDPAAPHPYIMSHQVA
ncbi:MAG: DUF512 domain-containing protein [Gemmatimonadota bacterium]|nr:DUF512 domain-containing protein [Gemmatimonadota bacterium]